MGFTNDFEIDVLDAQIKGGDFYVGLSSSTPAEDGSNVTEHTIGAQAYARIRVGASGVVWASATTNGSGNGESSNSADITFAEATGDWLSGNNVTYAVLFNHATGTATANVMAFGALTTAKPVLNGDTAKILAGNLKITLE